MERHACFYNDRGELAKRRIAVGEQTVTVEDNKTVGAEREDGVKPLIAFVDRFVLLPQMQRGVV